MEGNWTNLKDGAASASAASTSLTPTPAIMRHLPDVGFHGSQSICGWKFAALGVHVPLGIWVDVPHAEMFYFCGRHPERRPMERLSPRPRGAARRPVPAHVAHCPAALRNVGRCCTGFRTASV